jgi:hypothetical protein
MPRFGLFTGSSQQPDQQFEGDQMTQEKEFVQIYDSAPLPPLPLPAR